MRSSPIIKSQATCLKMESLKISKIQRIDLLIIATSLLLVSMLLVINYSNLDIFLQNKLFDDSTQSWLIDRDEPIKKIFFYKLPKILLAILIIFCLFAAIFGFRKKSQFFHKNRHHFFLIFLGLSLIPLIAGNIKKFTNVYCPNQLQIYGGDKPYVKIFNHYDKNFYQEKKGKCFPAGHAITGFALFIFCFALHGKLQKIFSFFFAATSGWVLGFYQMAKGAHFFGDNLVTMLVCFLLAAILARLYKSKLAIDTLQK